MCQTLLGHEEAKFSRVEGHMRRSLKSPVARFRSSGQQRWPLLALLMLKNEIKVSKAIGNKLISLDKLRE